MSYYILRKHRIGDQNTAVHKEMDASTDLDTAVENFAESTSVTKIDGPSHTQVCLQMVILHSCTLTLTLTLTVSKNHVFSDISMYPFHDVLLCAMEFSIRKRSQQNFS